ncbi:hypothetical protein KDL01_07285 [Actinospica durhamensis]|uniref:Protein phosphatase 2C domain-containing protein n=1 Tax=Actinospica durhamensis TaxID=1508375 RepID=A0A941EI94_9ACTN|nr:hypothetical protein [Actinospica durhamensis]MBR7833060.1 hypothetical protein [Actinospica durhamensis]
MRSPAFIARYLVPKQGHRVEQCEDAVIVLPASAPADEIDQRIVAALCDGASESLLARAWADMLAKHLAEPRIGHSVKRTVSAVTAAADEWDTWLEGYVKHREAAGRPLAWYERPGLERGAYATLLRVALDPPAADAQTGDELMRLADAVGTTGRSAWHWHAAALGDTCLFHVRGNRVLRAFPIEDSSEFDTNPSLACSRNADRALLAKHVADADGWCESGDQLYLATDALAAWFLRHTEAGDRPWAVLREFAGRDVHEFEAFVAAERAAGTLRNDDVAFVHIDIG